MKALVPVKIVGESKRKLSILENTRETGWHEGPFVLRNIVHPNALFKQNISSTNNALLNSNLPIDAKNIDDCR